MEKQAIIAKSSNVTHAVVKITPDHAVKLLEGNTHNRPIRDGHVAKLGRAMTEGRWQLNGMAVVISKTGKVLDGQHRLWACVEAGVPFQTILITGVEDDAFTTLGDQLARIGSDLFAYYGVRNHKIVAPAVTLMYFYETHNLAQMESAKKQPSQDELYGLFSTSHPALEDIAGECGPYRHLLSPSIVAFFKYVLSLIDLEKSNRFFEQLLFGVGANGERMPVYHLRRRLEQDRTSKAKLPRIEKLALIIKAWNLHLAGSPCSSLRYSSKEGFPEIQKAA